MPLLDLTSPGVPQPSPSPELSDAALLAAFARRRCELSLVTLIRRHLGFVSACAFRQVGSERQLADDVVQAVFILMTTRAASLIRVPSLKSWLFTTTRYAASNALRMQARRRYHERRAAQHRTELCCGSAGDARPASGDDEHFAIEPVLDDALASLGERERAGVLLSFFDNKTYREVGLVLGVSEEAARKRVTRAVDKLRAFFESRGVRVGSSGALAGSLALFVASTQASAASESGRALLAGTAGGSASAESIAATALTVTTTTLSAGAGPAAAIAKGVADMFLIAKVKLAAAAVLALCAVGGATGVAVVATAWAQNPTPGMAASAQPEGRPPVARFDDGVSVEIAGVSNCPPTDSQWWCPDGTPCEPVCDPSQSQDQPPHRYTMCVKLEGAPEDAGVVWKMPNTNWSAQSATRGGTPIPGGKVFTLLPVEGASTLDVKCLVATGEWNTIAGADFAPGDNHCAGTGSGGVMIACVLQDGQPAAIISHDIVDLDKRIIVIDNAGEAHPVEPQSHMSAGKVHQLDVRFPLPVEQVKRVEFQTRPYNHVATFRNVSLESGRRTEVKVEKE